MITAAVNTYKYTHISCCWFRCVHTLHGLTLQFCALKSKTVACLNVSCQNSLLHVAINHLLHHCSLSLAFRGICCLRQSAVTHSLCRKVTEMFQNKWRRQTKWEQFEAKHMKVEGKTEGRQSSNVCLLWMSGFRMIAPLATKKCNSFLCLIS